MKPLPRPSVSPLPSNAVRPRYVAGPPPSFIEMARLVWRWLRGIRPDWRQAALEARIVDKIAAEMDDEVKGRS